MRRRSYLKKFIIYSLIGMGVCLFALLAGCGGVYVMTPVPSETATATPEPSATIDWFPATATSTQSRRRRHPRKRHSLYRQQFPRCRSRSWVLARRSSQTISAIQVYGARASLKQAMLFMGSRSYPWRWQAIRAS